MLKITLSYFIIIMLQRDVCRLLPVLVFLPLDSYTLFSPCACSLSVASLYSRNSVLLRSSELTEFAGGHRCQGEIFLAAHGVLCFGTVEKTQALEPESSGSNLGHLLTG